MGLSASQLEFHKAAWRGAIAFVKASRARRIEPPVEPLLSTNATPCWDVASPSGMCRDPLATAVITEPSSAALAAASASAASACAAVTVVVTLPALLPNTLENMFGGVVWCGVVWLLGVMEVKV